MKTNELKTVDLAPSQDMSGPVIRVKNVTKSFGDETAVREVNFEVPRASIFGFVGPSGSGKTTTVRLLTGVYVPTQGEIAVLNVSPAKFSQDQRARVGYMPQLFVFYPNLTVWENINFAASLYGVSPVRRSKRLRQVLELVELYEHRRKLARDISGGMQRRLSLAAALVHNPELLFLDEPTAGIDPILRHKFWERFKELQKQGRTLFITTQYVNEADNCDLVGVMSNGKLLLVDTPHGLRQHVYGGDILDLRTAGPIDYHIEQLLSQANIKTTRTGQNSIRLIVSQASTAIPELMALAQQHNLQVEALEQFTPPFEDTFVDLVRAEAKND
jgi:ABC-2 type transport system ATP-binding protein